MNKLLKQLNGLQKADLKWLIAALMIEGNLSYKELSESYVWYLEVKKKEKHLLINSMSIPLAQYWHEQKISKCRSKAKHGIFIRSKMAYVLLKSKCYKTAPIEKEFKDWLKDNPYSEDKDGHHTFNE